MPELQRFRLIPQIAFRETVEQRRLRCGGDIQLRENVIEIIPGGLGRQAK